MRPLVAEPWISRRWLILLGCCSRRITPAGPADGDPGGSTILRRILGDAPATLASELPQANTHRVSRQASRTGSCVGNAEPPGSRGERVSRGFWSSLQAEGVGFEPP